MKTEHMAPVARLTGAMTFEVAVIFPWLAPPVQPYEKGSVQAAEWKRGFVFQAGVFLRADTSAKASAKADVSHETNDETIPRGSPGRGRGKLGPRSEWSDLEKTVAWCAQHALTRAEIAALLPRRNRQAVSNQLNRMKARQRTDDRGQRSALRQAQDEGRAA